jgi:hypothetical protein
VKLGVNIERRSIAEGGNKFILTEADICRQEIFSKPLVCTDLKRPMITDYS